jgi:hypothetical protein
MLPPLSGPELLLHILNDEPLCLAFGNFLKSKYSYENISFWLAAEKWKSTYDLDGAKEIFERYIKDGSELQVNIEGWIRSNIETIMLEETLENPPQSVFQMAQDQIFHLMYFSLLPDFQAECKPKNNNQGANCRKTAEVEDLGTHGLDPEKTRPRRRTWEYFVPCI